MLLTKPLTTLLSSSLSPPLSTLLLLTPTGHILSSASPLPSSLLRARATLALQIWDLYAQNPSIIPAALPSSPSDSDATHDDAPQEPPNPHEAVASVAVQLSAGALVVRGLKCGLLICGIAAPEAAPDEQVVRQRLGMVVGQAQQYLAPGSPPQEGVLSSAASDAGSVATVGGRGGREVAVLRRRVEEVARWLDGELGGFEVSEGI